MSSTALQMPIRIYVKGASTVSWMSFMDGPRTDFTFPRVVESELLQSGRPVAMWVSSVPSERTRQQLKRWERELGGWSPDVVVLSFMHAECVHAVLPLRMQRYVDGLTAPSGPVRDVYRKRVLKPAWRRLARLQKLIDTRLPSSRRRRLDRAARDLETLTRRIARFSSPLILVCDVPYPSASWLDWFPGMPARTAYATEQARKIVERIDLPNVRFFETRPIMDDFAARGHEPAGDGAHFSPEVHAAVGQAMARVVEDWALTQPHLRAPGA